MCRFLVFKGADETDAIPIEDLLVKPSHSILLQSFQCRERRVNAGLPPELNADGFGIGWYSSPDAGSDTGGHGDAPEGLRGDAHEPGETVLSLGPGWSGGDSTGYDVRRLSVAERLPSRSVARRRVVNMPGVFTSITPAWNNTNLRTLSAKIRSSMVFAHVRAAALGAIVSDQNCHPFTFGRWLFMHNGMVSGFGRVRRRLLQALPDELFGTIRGNTDSEHCFALFLSKLAERASLLDDATEAVIAGAMRATVDQLNVWQAEAGVRAVSLLNFAVTDGRTVLATRWAREAGSQTDFRMLQELRQERVAIIASERLTHVAEDWVQMPHNSMLVISPALTVSILPLDVPSLNDRLEQLASERGSVPEVETDKAGRVCGDDRFGTPVHEEHEMVLSL